MKSASAQKLAVITPEGLHRCWVNDTPGRIAERLAAGYVHVYENGAHKSRAVGFGADGQPTIAYLLECSYEAYQRQIGVLPPAPAALPATEYWERTLPGAGIVGVQAVNMTGKQAADKLFATAVEEDDEAVPEPVWRPWRLIHHARPGHAFIGALNWHREATKDVGWFRLIFRPRQNWHFYVRLCWRPKLKIHCEAERRGF